MVGKTIELEPQEDNARVFDLHRRPESTQRLFLLSGYYMKDALHYPAH